MRFASFLKARSEPWALTEPALRTILEIAARQNESPQAVAARLGRELDNTHCVTVRDGVAIIPVNGPLFRYANLFTMVSGASSYEILARDLHVALDDPAIKAIILDVDSPGGEVNGCNEFSDMIYAARGRKPIVAYASGDACSGAYWIASATDEIVCEETACLGSIGVVAVYEDATKAKEMAGVKTIEIVSSQSPLKRADPSTDAGRGVIQTRIDALASVFVERVARNRGVSGAEVEKSYGRGDVLVGRHAVEAGLADRTGSLEGLIAELADTSSSAAPTMQVAAGSSSPMPVKSKAKATSTRKSATIAAKARSAEDEKDQVEEDDLEDQAEDDNLDETAEGEDEDKTDAAEDDQEDPASEDDEEDMESEDEDEMPEEEKPPVSRKAKAKATGERGRIQAILSHPEAKGRRKLAEHLAFGTNASPKTAAGILRTAPRASASASKGNAFASAMGAVGNPRIGNDKPASANDEAAQAIAVAKKLGLA